MKKKSSTENEDENNENRLERSEKGIFTCDSSKSVHNELPEAEVDTSCK